jgi:hypothetical protein
MNRTTLRTLYVAVFALAAASCSTSGSSPESSGGSTGAGNGSHTGGATGATAASGGSHAGGATATGGAGGGGAVLTPDAFGQKYKFADNALSGWTQASADVDPAAFDVYTSTDDLVARIDGAADAYEGFRVALFQDLMGPDPQTCNLVVMDYVTDNKANDKFTSQKDSGLPYVTITGYDESVAIATTNLTGITVYAHFKALYVELQMSGYLGSDDNLDLNKATAAAAQFLGAIKTKTN